MDCSTFSFDLHVLGAPPALILSRDQTLIVCCEFAKSPRLTQSTDEFFFTASNQIVKDLRSQPRNCERPEQLQASNLSQPQARIATPVASKLVNLKKNRTGRPYSADSGGPEQVLLPFLTEDLFPYTTVARLWQILKPARKACDSSDPQLATRSEYQSLPARCKRFRKKKCAQ